MGEAARTETFFSQVKLFRQELLDLVLSFDRIRLGGQPEVQVFDDLHWIDPASAAIFWCISFN